MIALQDILKLMREGFSHEEIRFGMPIKELRTKLGEPNNAIGDSQMGYLTYDLLRIGYYSDVVDEIAILFEEEDHWVFKLNLEELNGEIDTITNGTKINEFIKLFNTHGFMWRSQYRNNEMDYVSISVEHGSEVLFDLETGLIKRIAFVPVG